MKELAPLISVFKRTGIYLAESHSLISLSHLGEYDIDYIDLTPITNASEWLPFQGGVPVKRQGHTWTLHMRGAAHAVVPEPKWPQVQLSSVMETCGTHSPKGKQVEETNGILWACKCTTITIAVPACHHIYYILYIYVCIYVCIYCVYIYIHMYIWS